MLFIRLELFASLVIFGELVFVTVASETYNSLSQNVSEGQLAEFTCITTNSGAVITWSIIPPEVGSTTRTDSTPSSGGKKSVLRFTAFADNNQTTVRCVVTDINTLLSNIFQGVLLVQGPLSGVGNLTSSKVDHCTLHFTWTAPYTLHGVPINYYIINITRHSDGAVLRSDTTNTTEYLYTVSSLGETLEVRVAAVNGAGTGHIISVVTTLSSTVSSFLNLTSGYVARNDFNWTYTSSILEDFLCNQEITDVIVEACLSSSCVNVTGIMNMSAGVRRVMATFTNLVENRKYSASVHVQYNGGVVQQSQPVEISTFDIWKVSVTVLTVSQLCLNVEYIKGHTTPPYTFVRLNCPTVGYVQNGVIDGTDGCINIVSFNSTQNCNLSATDVDAISSIDSLSAVVVTVMLELYNATTLTSLYVIPNTISSALSTTPSRTPLSTSIGNLKAVKIGITAAIATLVVNIIIFCAAGLILKKFCFRKETASATISPVPDTQLYEKLYHLSSSSQNSAAIKDTPVYEDIHSVHASQKNIEIKECPAYGVASY